MSQIDWKEMRDYQKMTSAVAQVLANHYLVEMEASGRHIHLSQEDLTRLFGKGYVLTKAKELSQPGQYACQERVTITGPKGSIKNVVILGPPRGDTQIEISLTDARILGIEAPIRDSGDVANSPGLQLTSSFASIQVPNGLIVARRHLHITPGDAEKFHLQDKEIIRLKTFTKRPLIFDDVLVRVSKTAKTIVHLDYDEANACGFFPGAKAIIIKK